MDKEQKEMFELKYNYMKSLIKKAEKTYEVAEKSNKLVILTYDKRQVFFEAINTLKTFLSTIDNQYTLERFSHEKLNFNYNTVRKLCYPNTTPGFRQETVLKVLDALNELVEEMEDVEESKQPLAIAHAWYN